MKTILMAGFCALIATASVAQEQPIQTIFKNGHVGGYVALSNKFTRMAGEFANMPYVYGGVFINRRFLLGAGVAATTSYLPVPAVHSERPGARMSYGYAQGGLVTEWVMGSNRAAHLVFHLFTGAGYTMQYDRDFGDAGNTHQSVYDQNWFMVAEPGVQLELNLFRWMRLSPGISYRQTYDSQGRGLDDHALSHWTYSATLKLGKF